MDTHIIARSSWDSPAHNATMLRYAAQAGGKGAGAKFLYLNTASSSHPEYHDEAQKAVELAGGVYSTLDFFGSIRRDYAEYVLSHDVIYVGGGNTRSMLALWREYGLDQTLREAWQGGIVLTGFSAGAICWFEQGLTDSLAGENQVLKGLGFLSGSACPHYDSEEQRRPTYLQKVRQGLIMPGFALKDKTAVHFKNGQPHQMLTLEEGKLPTHVSREGTETEIAAQVIPLLDRPVERPAAPGVNAGQDAPQT